jgi:hypothetical protein
MIFDKGALSEKRTVSFTVVLGKLGIYLEKYEVVPIPYALYKISPKLVKDLNTGSKTSGRKHGGSS